MARRPRCLMVTRNFPPLTGGMERLNLQVLWALQEEFDVAVCGPTGSSAFAGDAVCSEFSATPAWRYVLESLFLTLKTATLFKPDIIYAGSGLATHAAALASVFTKTPLVTYLHGLDIIAPDKIYQLLFLPAIRRSNYVIVNSRNTAELAEAAGIPTSRISIIHPGTTLPDITKRTAQRSTVRSLYKLDQRPTLLIAGRLTNRKGIVEFIRNCMPAIVIQHPDLFLLVAGAPPSNALGRHKNCILADIRKSILELNLEKNIKLLGKVSDEELSSLYFASDLFVFPALDLPGDVEGFGMVAIEAAAHGLPTVGFAVGGIPDAVAENVSGYLAEPGNYRKLTDSILNHFCKNQLSTQTCRKHAEAFSWERFGIEIRELVRSVIPNYRIKGEKDQLTPLK